MLGLVLTLALLPARPDHPPDTLEFDAIARRGIGRVYNMEFETAEEDFRSLVRLAPHDPAGHFFTAMVDWWRILIDMENEQYDERFFDALDGVVDMCDSLLERDPSDVNALFFKGGAIGFKGRLKFHRGDYLAAANAGRKALPLVQEAFTLAPNNYDILLGTGIYDYYAEVVPNEFPFVKPLLLFIPPGDKQKGIQELTLASDHGRYASTEASYFLMQIYTFYEKDFGKALVLARRLHERFPANMVFHRYVGRSYSSLGNWPAVRESFGEVLEACKRQQRGYGAGVEREARYYLGQCDLQDRKYEEALAHFYRCDELSRGLDKGEASGFMAMANLKIGNLYDVQGRRDEAKEQYAKVLEMKGYQNSHELARRYLQDPFRP